MRSNIVASSAVGPRRRRPSPRALDSHLAQVFLRDLKAGPPPLLPIFRSRQQGELLARLLIGPEREVTMLDLAVMLRTDLASVSREVLRLARAGILTLRRVGSGRVVSRNTASPIYEPLAHLLLLTFGPAIVVAEEFGPLPGAHEVHLFGPWAARYEGIEGDLPRDIDVLVVGEASPADAYAAAQLAETRLGLPVNVVVRPTAQWRSTTDPFNREIRASPLVRIR